MIEENYRLPNSKLRCKKCAVSTWRSLTTVMDLKDTQFVGQFRLEFIHYVAT
jgi:hypothetical protein